MTGHFFKKIIIWVIILFFIVSFFIIPKGANAYVIWPCLLVFYVVFFNAIKKPISINGVDSFIKIDVLFYLFYFLIYYLPYQQYVLGFNSLKSTYPFNDYIEYTNVSIIASTIALLSFSLGLYYMRSREIIIVSINLQKNIFRENFNLLFSTLIVVLSILMLIYYYSAYSIFFSGAYIGSETGDRGIDGVYFMCNFFFMLFYSIFIFYWKYHKKINILTITLFIISSIWILFLLIYGDRNIFLLHVIVFVGGYFSIIRNSNRKSVLIFLLLALLIYQIVGTTRTVEERTPVTYVRAVLENNNEDGKSSFNVTTIGSRATFHIVSDYQDFYYGKLKLIGIAGIIPFSRGLFVAQDELFATSSDVITYYLMGDFANSVLGTNIVSDLYFDFGIAGIVIFMLLIGLFAGFVQNKAQTYPNSLKWTVMYLLTLASFAELPRYGFESPVRILVWAFFLISIFERKQKSNFNEDSFLVN